MLVVATDVPHGRTRRGECALALCRADRSQMYLYAPREKQVPAMCKLKPLSFCNTVYGMTIGRGSWTFRTGEWTDIRQDVWMNRPGRADGGFNIWINGALVLSSSAAYYRNPPVSKIGGLPFLPPANFTTIDYDAIPQNVTIPNGGFVKLPVGLVVPTSTATATGSTITAQPTFTFTIAGKVVAVNTADRTPRKYAQGYGQRMAKRRAAEKRQTAGDLLPIGFLGMMVGEYSVRHLSSLTLHRHVLWRRRRKLRLSQLTDELLQSLRAPHSRLSARASRSRRASVSVQRAVHILSKVGHFSIAAFLRMSRIVSSSRALRRAPPCAPRARQASSTGGAARSSPVLAAALAAAALGTTALLLAVPSKELRAEAKRGYESQSQLHGGKVGTIHPGLFMSVPALGGLPC